MSGNLFASGGGSEVEWYTAWCDGGSRGNPGPSGYGAVVQDPSGQTAARLSRFLGIQTNNYAEYQGLLAVLEWSLARGVTRLRVISDSELMVKQMKGQYKVASPVLRPLWEEARKRVRQLGSFEITHTLRGGNKEADQLANDAMDAGMKKPVAQRVGEPAGQPAVAGGAGKQAAGEVSGHAMAGHATGRVPERATDRVQDRVPPVRPEAREPRQVLEGYVKNGVVHLLEGELPDGVFVKIVRE
jgi:ribonuclease HI